MHVGKTLIERAAQNTTSNALRAWRRRLREASLNDSVIFPRPWGISAPIYTPRHSLGSGKRLVDAVGVCRLIAHLVASVLFGTVEGFISLFKQLL